MADLESRASSDRREAMTRQDQCVAAWLREIVQEAVEVGDLPVASIATAGDVAFSLFCHGDRYAPLRRQFPARRRATRGGVTPEYLKDNAQALLDGLGWRPLRSEWDYGLTQERIVREVFADECRRAGLA